jgi:hypothetical protein
MKIQLPLLPDVTKESLESGTVSQITWQGLHEQGLLNKIFHVKFNERIRGIVITDEGIKANIETLPQKVMVFCTATHPDTPLKSKKARGRKLHIAKDNETTYCNMLVDEVLQMGTDRFHHFDKNGRCKSCNAIVNQ